MANLDNQSQRFIYIRSLKEKVPCTEQQFWEEATRIRKKEQYYHRCKCPKQFNWACDGDCDNCEHHLGYGLLSLDAPNTVNGSTLLEWEDLATSDLMKKVISDRILLELLFQRLRGIDPDADKIIEYWKDDCSISDREIAKRLGRNTLDRLKYIRQLKDMNIPVLFEKESINTMDAKGEVLITIMASLAQQESQSLSQNVKMGLQYRYQQGKVQINHNRFLGYTKDAEGNLVIDPEQAEIVKRIYREYLKGLSMDKIAAGLERDGILTGAGGKKWHTSTINKILRNEKYIGDALLQKTYTTDFLYKTRVKNNGLVPQYYVEGDHEAIIPKDIYLQVQEELVRRRVVKTSANGKKTKL